MAEASDDAAVRVEVDGHRLSLSNLDKVLYPGTETTKAEVLQYYAQVAPALVPVLAGRPVTRVRWPHGTGGDSFFEKNLPKGAPSWMDRVTITGHGSRGGGAVTYPLVDGIADLTYLANLAALELHIPQWQVHDDEPADPDRLVIDLDPGSPAGLHECAQVALLVRAELGDRGLECVPVTSGSKGMQLYAKLPGEESAESVREQVKKLATDLTRAHPTLVLFQMTPSRRRGKVFLDWSQNTAAKTTIAPYSLRGRDRPTVAAPRSWAEIEAGADEPDFLRQLDMDQVIDRLHDDGDLFAPISGGEQVS